MPYYVTTPIYYVNGEPHLGHVYTTVAADVLALGIFDGDAAPAGSPLAATLARLTEAKELPKGPGDVTPLAGLDPAAIGDVLVGGDPAAIGHGLMGDGDGPTVWGLAEEGPWPALGQQRILGRAHRRQDLGIETPAGAADLLIEQGAVYVFGDGGLKKYS